MKTNFTKHESGYYITDPIALKEWQEEHCYATGEHEQFMALVQVKKSKVVPSLDSSTGMDLVEPDEGPSTHWIVTDVRRDRNSSIYFEVYKGVRHVIGKTSLGNCWFSREVIPLEFIKSPARLALESLAC